METVNKIWKIFCYTLGVSIIIFLVYIPVLIFIGLVTFEDVFSCDLHSRSFGQWCKKYIVDCWQPVKWLATFGGNI